jgi:nucleoside-diphosphate-sugar epimerase
LRDALRIGESSALGRVSVRMLRHYEKLGLLVPGARASVEMMYEFARPFVVDSGRIERAFGLLPTPVGEGIRRTVAWHKAQTGRAAQ